MEHPVYVICFWVGLIFTIISALAGHLFGGGGHDFHSELGTGGHAEAGFDNSGMPGMSAISPTTIASFVTAFGGFGAIFSKIEATSSPLVTALLAASGGIGVAGGVFWLFNTIFLKVQGSSESRFASLPGQSATIITPIPENGVGEIAYVQSGTRYSAPARAENGVVIENGKTVKITRVVGTQFYVQQT